jgi:hypothetical protein
MSALRALRQLTSTSVRARSLTSHRLICTAASPSRAASHLSRAFLTGPSALASAASRRAFSVTPRALGEGACEFLSTLPSIAQTDRYRNSLRFSSSFNFAFPLRLFSFFRVNVSSGRLARAKTRRRVAVRKGGRCGIPGRRAQILEGLQGAGDLDGEPPLSFPFCRRSMTGFAVAVPRLRILWVMRK